MMGNQKNISMTTKPPIKAHLNTYNGHRKITYTGIHNLRAPYLYLNFTTYRLLSSFSAL